MAKVHPNAVAPADPAAATTTTTTTTRLHQLVAALFPCAGTN